ncbi:MAG: hypothetical protein Q8O00_07895 [Holophaga sp.]|nr:hypothetical protein [Holophaga sp.]
MAIPTKIRRVSPPSRPEPSPANSRGPVLIFTLKEPCPARLCTDDLQDPNRFHHRLVEWLKKQR